MINWSKTNLSIDFETISVNQKTMSLIIVCDGKIWTKKPMPEGITTWSQDIILPTKVSLIFGNRDKNSTLVDSHNNIIKNMSIIIKSIKLDNLPCWPHWTDSNCITEQDDTNELIISSTICENGKMDIIFDDTNSFSWLVKSKLS